MERSIMNGTTRPRRSRSQRMLDYLVAGNTLTGRAALTKFGIYRLSGFIFNWRKAGYTIETTMRKRHGQFFASYRLTSTPS